MEHLNHCLRLWGLEMPSTPEKFRQFQQLLLETNKTMNLTRITDPKEVEIKHFADSLSPLLFPSLDRVETVIDIGTGAGFPGIPLKLQRNHWKMTLLDSLNKRVRFLEEVIEKLDLHEIRGIHGRAEELGRDKEHREQYDLAVSRAVANMTTLCEYCLPFVKPGGQFVALKGPGFEEELEAGAKALEVLGGRVADIKTVELPEYGTHTLVLVEKFRKTPSEYPRGGGKPRKSPIGLSL